MRRSPPDDVNKWLVLLILLPLAGAQTEVLTDDAGDVAKVIMGTDAAIPLYDAADLRSLTIQEETNGFQFSIGLESLETNAWFLEQVQIFIRFEHQDARFQVGMNAAASTPAQPIETANGFLQKWEETNQNWQTVGFVSGEVVADGFTFFLERETLLDRNGAPPSNGRTLSNIHVESSAGLIFTADPIEIRNYDLMPDDGDVGTFEVKLGVAQEGTLSFDTKTPYRASNGEATTYLFRVNLTNAEPSEVKAQLSAANVPSEWEIILPGEEILVPGNGSLELPVLASVPFRHLHGARESFILEATGENGVGRVQLGVLYLEIPQPAGHHNEMYIHTVPRGTDALNQNFATVFGNAQTHQLMMNTEPEYELADPVPMTAVSGAYGVGAYVGQWQIPLSPALAMGLAFDESGTGTMDLTISAPISYTDAQPSGRLTYLSCNARSCDQQILGIFQSDPVTITSTGTNVQFVFTPNAGSDHVPFDEDGAQLRLDLEVVTTEPQSSYQAALELQPGGKMELPLLEFHDALDSDLFNLIGIDLVAADEMEQSINPEEVALYNFTLTNTGVTKTGFELSIAGGSTWAEILGSTEITVGPGDGRPIVVAVTVPAGSSHGTVADFALQAASSRDPSLKSVVPFRATVDTAVDHPDQSHLVLQKDEELTEQEAPFAPLILVGLALLGSRKLKQA